VAPFNDLPRREVYASGRATPSYPYYDTEGIRPPPGYEFLPPGVTTKPDDIIHHRGNISRKRFWEPRSNLRSCHVVKIYNPYNLFNYFCARRTAGTVLPFL
jgi:hypothetical protein